MRRWLLAATAIYLAACSAPSEDADGPRAGDPGTYSRNLSDGTAVVTTIREDGTFLTVRGSTMRVGTAETEGDTTCFTTKGLEDEEPACWTNGPIRPGGTFETVGPDAQPVIVTYTDEIAPVGASMAPGRYEVGDDTTAYGQAEIREDGTYTDFADGKAVGGGTWTADGERACFDPEGNADHQKERCWINGAADENGRFLTTREDGSTAYFVTPIKD